MSYPALGLASLVVGAMAMIQGLWMAITARRPRWVNARVSFSGRERQVGLAVIALGVGLVLIGASYIEPVAFAGLLWLGLVPSIVGVVVIVVAYRVRPSR